MKFSIIIATRNRRDAVLGAVAQFSAQDYPPHDYEIIAVDNASTDGTRDALERLKGGLPHLTVCGEERLGVSFARNAGVLRARYDHLIFIDDDIVVPKTFLKAYEKAWRRHPDAGALGGGINAFLQQGEMTPAQREIVRRHGFCFSHLDLGERDRALGFGELVFAPNMSVRKPAGNRPLFDVRLGTRLYQFNEDCLRGEEHELCMRLMLEGKRVIYVADPAMKALHRIHAGQLTEDYLLKRYYFAGIESYVAESVLKSRFPRFGRMKNKALLNRLTDLFKPGRGRPRLFSKYWLAMMASHIFNGKYYVRPLTSADLPAQVSEPAVVAS